MSTVTKRFLWADLIRIIAIYLVIVLHSSVLPEKINLQSFDIRFITHAIPNACIPLFVMLSGALLLGKKETYQVFFKKRLTRIIIPWFAWTVVFVAIAALSKGITSPMEFVKEFTTTLQSFWFLPMIVCLYLLTPALRLFVQTSKVKDILLVIALWFLGISVLPYLHNTPAFPLFVDNGLVNQVVNYLGYFLLGYVLVTAKTPKAKMLSAVLIMAGIIWATAGTISFSMAAGRVISEYYRYISPGTVLIAAGLFLLIYSATKTRQIHNKFLNKLIVSVSSAALAIYFIHSLIQQLLVHFFGKYNLIAVWLPIDAYLNGLLIFMISFGVLWGLFRITFIKKLFI